ncbi:phenolic glucoside malonyltransferase 2-like [Brassica napus]|nr:phenolic glucoside malonyltransferase 2-like [Brassica napus]
MLFPNYCVPLESFLSLPPMTMHVVEVSRVTPAPDSDSVQNSVNSLAIPLTFFDIPWLVFNPVKRVFFYKITGSTRENFHSFILPKLKLSLSLVLRDYLHLCGCITSNPNEPKPSIVVSQKDAVSVTIAETDADFSLLSSYGQRPAFELHALIPELPVSDDSAKVLSLQITLFPEQGFSIGVAAHHGVVDGKMSTMFVKAWAHTCKQENRVVAPLPEALTPSLDRSLIKDTTGLDEQMIRIVRSLKQGKLIGRGGLSSAPASEGRDDDVVFATLVLSRGDVERLRERVKNESPDPSQLHLSTFVISYAYMWTCLVKARGGNMERSVSFLFVADFRERLDPPLPATYFGNCMFPAGCYNSMTAAEFAGEGGFVTAVEILSGMVKGLSSRKIETIAEEFKISFDCFAVTSQFGSLAGSTRLGVYDSDFGWGRPVKVDVVSIEGNTISMAERREESGGIELGLCMKKADLDIVLTLFNKGLQN